MENNILLTYVKCLNCDEVLISHHNHDFNICTCLNQTMIDGGYSYTRYGGVDMNLVEPNIIYTNSPFEVIREFFARGGRGINGDQPLTHTILKDINDDWLKAIVVYEEKSRPNNPYLIFFKKEMIFRRDMVINEIFK